MEQKAAGLYLTLELEKKFLQTSYQVWMDLKKYRNQAEMSERWALHLQKYTADMG